MIKAVKMKNNSFGMIAVIATLSLLIVSSIIPNVAAINPTNQIIEEPIISGGDDGFVTSFLSQGDLNDDSSFISIGQQAEDVFSLKFSAYLRFTNITIPTDAKISKAYITVVPTFTNQTGPLMKITAANHSNPTAPKNYSNYSTCNRTDASVDWNASYWYEGVSVNSPDISGMIQELVDSYNYSTGASILIFLDDVDEEIRTKYQAFAAYEHLDYAPAELHIEYVTIEEEQPPFASFSYSPEKPVVNQTVTFDASSSNDLDGYIINYEWDFGDANITSTTKEIIMHSYSSTGDYMVTLRVTDNQGIHNTSTELVSVKEKPMRVLFDRSHVEQFRFWGDYSDLSEELENSGYALYQLGLAQDDDIEITCDLLEHFDVLALPNPQISGGYLTQSEILSVSSFVEKGGGLLVLGGRYPISDSQYPVKDLISKFGIEYEIPIARLGSYVTDLRDHPVMDNVDTLYLALGPDALKIINSSANGIAYSSGKPVIAVSEYGQGRVAVISAEHTFTDDIAREDNLKMALNLFQWLSENSPLHEDDLPKMRIIDWNPPTNMRLGEEYKIDIKIKNAGNNGLNVTVVLPNSWVFDERGHGIGEFFFGDSTNIHINPLTTKEASLMVKTTRVGYTYIEAYVYTQFEDENLLMDGVYTGRVEIIEKMK
jgi:PKD repeat protein